MVEYMYNLGNFARRSFLGSPGIEDEFSQAIEKRLLLCLGKA